MGLGGVSVSQLLIILLIAALLFGTKRLRTVGTDLGAAIRSFRRSMSGVDDEEPEPERKRLPDAGRAEKPRPAKREADT